MQNCSIVHLNFKSPPLQIICESQEANNSYHCRTKTTPMYVLTRQWQLLFYFSDSQISAQHTIYNIRYTQYTEGVRQPFKECWGRGRLLLWKGSTWRQTQEQWGFWQGYLWQMQYAIYNHDTIYAINNHDTQSGWLSVGLGKSHPAKNRNLSRLISNLIRLNWSSSPCSVFESSNTFLTYTWLQNGQQHSSSFPHSSPHTPHTQYWPCVQSIAPSMFLC
jgi:hypothetical protein